MWYDEDALFILFSYCHDKDSLPVWTTSRIQFMLRCINVHLESYWSQVHKRKKSLKYFCKTLIWLYTRKIKQISKYLFLSHKKIPKRRFQSTGIGEDWWKRTLWKKVMLSVGCTVSAKQNKNKSLYFWPKSL